MARSEGKTLYLDAAVAAMRLDGDALRIERPEAAVELVPLRRVGRAVVRGAREDLLRACLELVRRGGTVHFQTANGDPIAVLQNAHPEESDVARELAELIEAYDGLGPFEWWQEAQRRHAWSLVFRRGYPGDFESNRRRLRKYLATKVSDATAHEELARLDAHLRAWLQHEILRQGMQCVAHALGGKGADLMEVLWQCLSLTTTWAYVRWRREQQEAPGDRELVRFFELRAAVALPEQLGRHMRALAGEYHTSWRLLNASSALRLDDV